MMLNLHYFRRTALKKKIYREIYYQLVKKGRRMPAIEGPARVHATRYGIRLLDGFDNFPGSLKWAVDALVKMGVLISDNAKFLKTGRMTQIKVSTKRQERVVVRIETLKSEYDGFPPQVFP